MVLPEHRGWGGGDTELLVDGKLLGDCGDPSRGMERVLFKFQTHMLCVQSCES